MSIQIHESSNPRHDDATTRERINLDIAPPNLKELTASQPRVKTKDHRGRGGARVGSSVRPHAEYRRQEAAMWCRQLGTKCCMPLKVLAAKDLQSPHIQRCSKKAESKESRRMKLRGYGNRSDAKNRRKRSTASVYLMRVVGDTIKSASLPSC
eukprot:5965727-Amphidinium_carterae.1